MKINIPSVDLPDLEIQEGTVRQKRRGKKGILVALALLMLLLLGGRRNSAE